jgi:hypothetical protein
VSQLAAALGLPVPPSSEPTRVAWETLPLLRSWLDLLRPLDDDALAAPTRSRGRSLRNLTVNVFHPFELLPAAWSTQRFPWQPELDGEREEALREAPELIAYAERILEDWTDFVVEQADELGRNDPVVASPRGELRFSALLESQLEHVSFHREQLVEFLHGGSTLYGRWSASSGPGSS